MPGVSIDSIMMTHHGNSMGKAQQPAEAYYNIYIYYVTARMYSLYRHILFRVLVNVPQMATYSFFVCLFVFFGPSARYF